MLDSLFGVGKSSLDYERIEIEIEDLKDAIYSLDLYKSDNASNDRLIQYGLKKSKKDLDMLCSVLEGNLPESEFERYLDTPRDERLAEALSHADSYAESKGDKEEPGIYIDDPSFLKKIIDSRLFKYGTLIAIGGAAISASGCLDDDTSSDSSVSIEYDDVVDESPVNDDSDVTDNKEPVEKDPLDDYPHSGPHDDYFVLGSDENLLGVEISGVSLPADREDGCFNIADQEGDILYTVISYDNGNVMEIYNLDGEGDPDIVMINTEETGLIGFEYAGHNDIKAYLGYYNHPDLYEHVEDINVKPLDNSDIIKYKKLN